MKATTKDEKDDFTLILKGIYEMKEERVRQIEILESFHKTKVA